MNGGQWEFFFSSFTKCGPIKIKFPFFFVDFRNFSGPLSERKRKKKSKNWVGIHRGNDTNERTNTNPQIQKERKKEKGEVVVVGKTIETFKLFLNISGRGRDWPRVFLSTEEGPRVAKRQRKRVNLALITRITNVF